MHNSIIEDYLSFKKNKSFWHKLRYLFTNEEELLHERTLEDAIIHAYTVGWTLGSSFILDGLTPNGLDFSKILQITTAEDIMNYEVKKGVVQIPDFLMNPKGSGLGGGHVRK